MPRFKSQARALRGVIAALALALALLSGCGPATTPLAGGASQPDPFALRLPTPTNTAGIEIPALPVEPTRTAAPPTLAPLTATPSVVAATPAEAATQTATAAPAEMPTQTPPVVATPTTLSATPPADAQVTPTMTLSPPPTGTPSPTATSDPGAAPTRTRAVTIVPADTPTSVAGAAPTATSAPAGTTATPTAAHTPTWSPTPTEPVSTDWDLARDVVGMWEYVDGDWRYYFDFFADGRVVISQSGVRPYAVRDARTLVIQMPNGEWPIYVVDWTPERMTLEGVINASDEFDRVHGTPDLESRLIGLWLDGSGEFPSVEFTADGIAVGEFGRGTYQVMSENSVLVACDQPENCTRYLEYGQPNDAPLSLRIYGATDTQLTLQGFGFGQQWTLDRRAGIPDLATKLLGRWVDDWGFSVEFTDDGDWIVEDDVYGSYEVLSDSTLWTVLEGEGLPLVVFRLTGSELAYAEWGYFYEDDLWVYDRESG